MLLKYASNKAVINLSKKIPCIDAFQVFRGGYCKSEKKYDAYAI